MYAFIRLILLVTLLWATAPVMGEVYVNRQWDEAFQDFRVKPLSLEGTGLTLDRGFQNEYGDSMDLDPGPPFIFEAAVNIMSIRDGNGDVEAWSRLTIRNDQMSPDKPFQLVFGDEFDIYNEVNFYVDGDLIMEGMAFDEILMQGDYRIRSYNYNQFSATGTENSFDIRFLHVDFRGTTSTSVPVVLQSGHTTFENCRIQNMASTNTWIVEADFEGPNQETEWSFTMKGCGIVDNEVGGYRPILVQFAGKTIVEDNYFDGNRFFSGGYPCLLELYQCGITKIDDNTAGSNLVDALRLNLCFADTTSYIQSSPDLPLLITNLTVPKDRTLTIDTNSVLKFYSYDGGIKNQGTTHIKGAILTSSADDSIGGDSDLQPQPATISPWCHSLYGSIAGGVTSDSTATILLQNSRIRYAKIGTQLRATGIIDGCSYEHCVSCGIHLYPRGDQDMIVRNTRIERSRTDGQAGLEAAIRLDDRDGARADVLIDSVTIANNNMRGFWLSSSQDADQLNLALKNSRILGNTGIGLNFGLTSSLAAVEVMSCMVVANHGPGIETVGMNTAARLGIHNTVIAGNGYGTYASTRYGVHINGGTLDFTGNTVALNDYTGLQLDYTFNGGESRIANSIFYRNRSRGLFQECNTAPVCAYNDFWGNATSELYFDTGSGAVTTVEDLREMGGEFATNHGLDPGTRPELFGTISAVNYDSASGRSTLVTTGLTFHSWKYDTLLVCPDTTTAQLFWYLVVERGGDTLTALGDVRAQAQPGEVCRLFDFRLASGSPLVDSGGSGYVHGFVDVEGNQRVLDGDDDGIGRVDVGAHEFNSDSLAIAVIRPGAGELFNPGDTCRIEWSSRYSDQLNLLYTVHPDSFPLEIATAQSAQLPYYDWIVPDSGFNSGRCQVLVMNDSGAFGRSGQFGIKGAELTRARGGDFERWVTGEDGWRFGNDSASMWPDSYWSTIDYVNGIDPHTGMKYPAAFASPTQCHAKASDYPDWQTWVRAFGVDQCYIETPVGRVYQTAALTRWTAMKENWGGSCMGLSVLSMLAFADPAQCAADFPNLGAFANLHDVTVADSVREVIATVFTRQFSRAMSEHDGVSMSLPPTVTLRECRQMLDSLAGVSHDAILAMCDWPVVEEGGCHAVTPIAVRQDSVSPQIWRIEVYDNNYPDSVGLAVEVDTVTATWSYAPFGWSRRDHLWFDLPAERYREPSAMGDKRRRPLHDAASEDTLSVYAPGADTVVISSDAGIIGRLGDQLVADSGVGWPILAIGVEDNAIRGFRIPSEDWTAEFTGLPDSMLHVVVDGDAAIMEIVVATGADSLPGTVSWDSGMRSLGLKHLGLPDWKTTVRAVQTAADSETVYEVADFTMTAGDSLDWGMFSGEGARLANWGGVDSAVFRLTVVSGTRYGEFVDSLMTVPAVTAFMIVPTAEDLAQNQIKVYVDSLIDGSIDDTTFLHNDLPTAVDEQGSSDDLPYRYELVQNYPNPFNGETVIRYALPVGGKVTLDVVNVLGQRVISLVDRVQGVGWHEVTWRGMDGAGRPVASGLYFYRMRVGGFSATKKLLLLK